MRGQHQELYLTSRFQFGMQPFLLRSGRIKEVEAQLTAILNRPPGAANPEQIAWARRTLALTPSKGIFQFLALGKIHQCRKLQVRNFGQLVTEDSADIAV